MLSTFKKVIFGFATGFSILAMTHVYAAPLDWWLEQRNLDDTEFVPMGVPTRNASTTPAILGARTNNANPAWYFLDAPFYLTTAPGADNNSYKLNIDWGQVNVMDLTGTEDALAGKASTSTVNSLSSTVSGLSSSVSSTFAEMNANLYGTSTSMRVGYNASTTAGLLELSKWNGLVGAVASATSTIASIQSTLSGMSIPGLASATSSGLLSSTLWTKLTNFAWSDITGKPSFATVATSGSYGDLSNKPTITQATSTRSLTSSTGATGFQVSSTKTTSVNYAVRIQTTASIGSGMGGAIILEIAPTNSSTASDWYQVGAECRNEQTVTLAAILQSVQTVGCNLTATVPAGYYAKLRTVNVTGTPTYTFVSGQDTIYNF